MNRSSITHSEKPLTWTEYCSGAALIAVLTITLAAMVTPSRMPSGYFCYGVFVMLILLSLAVLVCGSRNGTPRTFWFHWLALWPLGLGCCGLLTLLLLLSEPAQGKTSRQDTRIDVVLEVSPVVLFELSDFEEGFTSETIAEENGLVATAQNVCRYIDTQVFGSGSHQESLSWKSMVDWTMPSAAPRADMQPVDVRLHFAHGSDCRSSPADEDQQLSDILAETLMVEPTAPHLGEDFWSARPLGLCPQVRDLLSNAEQGQTIVVLTTNDAHTAEQRQEFATAAAKAGANLWIILLPSLPRADGRDLYTMGDKAKPLWKHTESRDSLPKIVSLCRLEGLESNGSNLTTTDVYSVPPKETPLRSQGATAFPPERTRRDYFDRSRFDFSKLRKALDGLCAASSQSSHSRSTVNESNTFWALLIYSVLLFCWITLIHFDVKTQKMNQPYRTRVMIFAIPLFSCILLRFLVDGLWENPHWVIRHYPSAATWVLMVTFLAIAIPPEVLPEKGWSRSSGWNFLREQSRYCLHVGLLLLALTHPVLGLVFDFHDWFLNSLALASPVLALVVFTILTKEGEDDANASQETGWTNVIPVVVFGTAASMWISFFFLTVSQAPPELHRQQQTVVWLTMIGVFVVYMVTIVSSAWRSMRTRHSAGSPLLAQRS